MFAKDELLYFRKKSEPLKDIPKMTKDKDISFNVVKNLSHN